MNEKGKNKELNMNNQKKWQRKKGRVLAGDDRVKEEEKKGRKWKGEGGEPENFFLIPR